MNQPDTLPEPSTEPASASPTAGQMLRAAREAKGLHLAVLSVNLKVSVRQLEALEADRHDEFKGLTFVRALAQSVARQLGIDPAPVLAALPQVAPQAAIAPSTLEAARQPVRAPSGNSAGLSRQVQVLAGLMLLGVAALIWWPSADRELPGVPDDTSDPAQAAVPMGQASDPVESPAPAASQEAAAPAEAVASQSARPVPAPVLPAASSPAPTVAATPAAAPAPAASALPAAAAAPLVIRLKADAWVEVRDGQGQMPVKRIVKAGETLQLSPTPPLFVYLGKADSAELRWQGQAVDLQPHTRNNEARLQIKP